MSSVINPDRTGNPKDVSWEYDLSNIWPNGMSWENLDPIEKEKTTVKIQGGIDGQFDKDPVYCVQ